MKVEEMSIEEISKKLGISIREEDLLYIFNGKNEEMVKEIKKSIIDNGSITMQEDIAIWRKYEQYINKRRLVFCSYFANKRIKSDIKNGHLVDLKNKLKTDELKVILEDRIRKNIKEQEKIIKEHEEFIKSMGHFEKGYIQMKGREFYLFSIRDILNMKDLTTRKEMIKVMDRLSTSTIAQLLEDNDSNSDEIYGVEGLRKFICQYTMLNIVEREMPQKLSNEEQEKENQYVRIFKQLINSIPEKAIKEIIIELSRYMDIKKMCLTSLAITHMRLELDNNQDKEDRVNYEKMLKELYSVIEGQKVQVEIGGKKYTTDKAEIVMQQFYKGKYYTKEEIENDFVIKYLTTEPIDNEYKEFIKNYIQSNKRRIYNANELKFLIDNIFTSNEILEMYLNGQVELTDLVKVIDDKEKEQKSKEIITYEEFIKRHKEMKKMRKDKENIEENRENIDENKENEYKKLVELYKETNMSGRNRKQHLKNILESLESMEDIEQLLKVGIITEKEADELIKESKKEKLNSKEGVEELLLIGEKTEREIVQAVIDKEIDRNIMIELYLEGKIGLQVIEEVVKDNEENEIIKEEDLADKIAKKIKNKEKDEKNETEIKKLALLYKNINLRDKTVEEREYIAFNFIVEIENKLQLQEMTDANKIYLYNIGIIPIETIMYECKGKEVEYLGQLELNVQDIKKLCEKNIINEENIEEIIKREDITLEQKLVLINVLYQETEDKEEMQNDKKTSKTENTQEKKQEMIRKLIEKTESSSQNEENKKQGKNRKQKENQLIEERKQEERIIEGISERINVLVSMDKQAKFETTQDGNIIVYLPNVSGGVVIIEQLYKKDKDKNLTLIYGRPIHIMSEYEYINCKNEIIQEEGKVNKVRLGELEKEGIVNRQVVETTGETYSEEEIKKIIESYEQYLRNRKEVKR